jgi:hypothetical protein
MFLKIINCNEFHSDLISLFEKLDKNIEIGAPFGEIKNDVTSQEESWPLQSSFPDGGKEIEARSEA